MLAPVGVNPNMWGANVDCYVASSHTIDVVSSPAFANVLVASDD